MARVFSRASSPHRRFFAGLIHGRRRLVVMAQDVPSYDVRQGLTYRVTSLVALVVALPFLTAY